MTPALTRQDLEEFKQALLDNSVQKAIQEIVQVQARQAEIQAVQSEQIKSLTAAVTTINCNYEEMEKILKIGNGEPSVRQMARDALKMITDHLKFHEDAAKNASADTKDNKKFWRGWAMALISAVIGGLVVKVLPGLLGGN